MAKKRGPADKRTAAAPPIATAVIDSPVAVSGRLIHILGAHARLIAVLAVLLGSARIIATYTVFNHTFDEPAHIACGMEWLDKGTYTIEAQHPPLGRVATAIGPYLLGIRSQGIDHSIENHMLKEGVAILYAGHNYDLTLAMARLGVLPFFWVACLVVFEWGRRYFHPAIGALAVCVFTCVPPVLAHAGLATTDMALAAFLGAAFLTGLMWLEEPTVRRAVLLGVSGGLAILSKFSCLAFFPASAGVALVWYLTRTRLSVGDLRRELLRRMPTLGLSAVIAFFVIWAGYRFSFGPVPFAHIKLPFPELFAGIQEVKTHNDKGHYAYLLGERGKMGWWYFFPVVLAVKTPLAFLILIGVWIWLAARGRLGSIGNMTPMAFALGIMAVAVASTINIGLRHILPIYIGLSIVVAVAAYWILDRPRLPRWQFAALGILAAWFAGSSLLSHPDYLPYFNELAGGHPENIVVDSDLDWGQDMKRLSKRLKELDVHQVYLSTLLVADFEKQHGFPHRIDKMDVINPPTGWVAIGFTYWKQLRLGLMDDYLQYTIWPDRIPPLEKVGKSVLLWYFPPGSAPR
jgi:4-amino-4-deoxy-L-arabinose transferase-like glycosyltransferase